MRAALRRVPVARKERQKSKVKTFPAPHRGWIANENLANVAAGGAFRLENFFPTQTGIRMRKGTALFATIDTNPVKSLFSYRSGATNKIFASNASSIFNISAVADPEVPPTADVTGQTSGYYSTVQFETAGGDFLYCVNGDDSPQLYDNSTWTAITGASSPAITGVTTSLLIQVWVYRSRLYFVEKNSMSAWYLPADSVGGAASEVSMRGVFQKGGSLLMGATWSLDAGDGVDDKCVFVSDQGEVAIFDGLDPGDATWRLVGRYDIASPLGKNATMRAGGDLLIMTEDGIVPISQTIHKDPAALSLAAITRQIEPEWKKEVTSRSANGPWEILKWPSGNMAIVGLPGSANEDPRYCFVVNVETGAWAKWPGYDVQCLSLHADHAYFGTMDGTILKTETGGDDNGAPYECIYIQHFDHLKAPAVNKHALMARGTFRASQPFNPKISVSTDYTVTLPSAPSSSTTVVGDVWGTGSLWGTAIWGSGGVLTTSTKWVSIGRNGFAIAPQLQITAGSSVAPDAELISFDLLYETGGVVV